jgi:DNA (cytosine-5)-methyltransferase 1
VADPQRERGRGGESRHEDAGDAGLSSEASCWGSFVWVSCGDGKTRRIEPSISPLAHGVPARVVRIRGYGNAIVPQLAATFLKSFLEAVNIKPIY